MVNVQYDDPAFYIFAISMLGVYAVPATYSVLGKLLRSTVLKQKQTQRRLFKGEEEKSKQLKAKRQKELWSTCFIAQIVILVVVWITLIILLSYYSSGGDIKQFDPYEILELDSSATPNEIRRAFRKLSLQYHPDKNKGNQEAADKFMLISKAHEALTDEEAKKNFEEFGSPDGKQQLQVAIGLPSFLMDKGNHTAILIVYLVVLVVMIPMGVATYYATSQKYGDNDIMKITHNNIVNLFKPENNFNCKQLPEILGSAEELATMKYKAPDAQALRKLWNKWEKSDSLAYPPIVKPKYFSLQRADSEKNQGHQGLASTLHKCFLNNVALTAHMMRVPVSPSIEANARQVLSLAPKLIETMIKNAFFVGMRSQHTNSWNVVNELIHFEQRVYQSLWDDGDRNRAMYLQFPHLSEQGLKAILGRSRRGGRGKAHGDHAAGFEEFGQLQAFLRQTPEDRKGLKDLSDEERRDINDVANIFPNWDVDISLDVDEEDIISEGAIVNLKITVTRNEIPEGQTATEIFAPRFPDGKYEGIWLLMGQPVPGGAKRKAFSTRLQAIKKLTSTDRVVEGVIQFKAPPQGQYRMLISAKSDSYFGCDFQQPVTFDVKAADSPELTAYVRHEEDLQLLKEVHGEVVGDDADSDSDSDDDDAPEAKTSGSAKKVDDEEEDDDDDDEESEDSSDTSEE